MSNVYQEYLIMLNSPKKHIRLNAVEKLMSIQAPRFEKPTHESISICLSSIYSFSPYSPSALIWQAKEAGLNLVGISDIDTTAGITEFNQAGDIADVRTVAQTDIRVNFSGTELEGVRINDLFQDGIAHVSMMGISKRNILPADITVQPIREARLKRMVALTERVSNIFKPCGITLSLYEDVRSLSMNREVGVVTEKHVLLAVAKKIITKYPDNVADCLENSGITVDIAEKAKLVKTNIHLEYDLLGILTDKLLPDIYIQAEMNECPPVCAVADNLNSEGIVPAYTYCGTSSEDSDLDKIIGYLAKIGFKAVTYQPSVLSDEQIKRIRAICNQYDLMELIRENIYDPRKSFSNSYLADDSYKTAITNAWALVGNALANQPSEALFSEESIAAYPSLKERIAHFAKRGVNNE